MTLTLQLPEEYAGFLPGSESDLAAILAAGLRHRRDQQRGDMQDLADVAEALANLPSPQAVLAMRPSERLAERTAKLLEKRRSMGLTSDEQAEWDGIAHIEHLVRMAKGHALAKLNADTSAA